MVFPEFSFCFLSSVILSKATLAFELASQTVKDFTYWTVGLITHFMINLDSSCVSEIMFSWLENKTRLCEAFLVIFFLILLIIYLDDRVKILSAFRPPRQQTYPSTPLTAPMTAPETAPPIEETFIFGYRRNNGPAVWKQHYEYALGTKQSPINIILREAVICKVGPLQWEHYSVLPESMVMFNDGYSVALEAAWTDNKPTVTGFPIDNEVYAFNRLYFHWGPTDTEGSEHTLDYERFPLELHVVFLKNIYTSLMDAHNEQCPNGILIVVFLFEITPVDNPGFLNTIVENLINIRLPRSGCCIEPFSLNDIYPEFRYGYYKYDGSITQPPCSEIVTYLVQKETIAISKKQMSRFRKLIAFDGKPMINNSRPVQKLNCRPVYYFTC